MAAYTQVLWIAHSLTGRDTLGRFACEALSRPERSHGLEVATLTWQDGPDTTLLWTLEGPLLRGEAEPWSASDIEHALSELDPAIALTCSDANASPELIELLGGADRPWIACIDPFGSANREEGRRDLSSASALVVLGPVAGDCTEDVARPGPVPLILKGQFLSARSIGKVCCRILEALRRWGYMVWGEGEGDSQDQQLLGRPPLS
jgi:hypothetical protein